MNSETQALIDDFLKLLLAEPAILTSQELQSLKALSQEIAVLSPNDIDNAVTKIQQWNDNHGDIWAKFDGLRDITEPTPDEKEATQFPNFNITTPAPDKSPHIQEPNLKESTPKPIIIYLKEALEKIIKTLEYE